MAITTAICTSFKTGLLKKLYNLDSGGDSFKFALIKHTPTGSYGAAPTANANITGNSDEVTGTGYTAGGNATTNTGVSASGTTAIDDFGNVSWTSASFSTDGAMMYDNTVAGKDSIALWDFGGIQTVTAQTFTLSMPASGAATSLIRIA